MKRLFLLSILATATAMPAYADTLIVGNKREHTVSFIDLTSGKEVRRVETGKAPHEVAVSPDGKTAVVVSYRMAGYIGNSLDVFDVLSGEKIKTIDLGEYKAPHGLKWVGDTSSVVVTTEASRHLIRVDIETGEVTQAISTGQEGSHMVALSPDLTRAFVANIGSGSVAIMDLTAHKRIRTVKAGQGTEAIAVTPDGREVWVGNNSSKNIMVFDAASFEKRATIKTAGIPIRVEISPDGAFAAVSEADLNRVSIYDVAKRDIITTIDMSPVGGKVPVTLLFDPDGSRLWAATTRAARVVEINTSDWTISRTLAAGQGSDGLGYSPVEIEAGHANDKAPDNPPD